MIEAKPLEMKQKTTTRLGRAVRSSVDDRRESPMIGKEKHSTNNSLRDVILGGQDGLVNMLGIALGVDFYLAEKVREQKEIEAQPDDEREEIREIYAAKGCKGQLLEDVVSMITSNRETWVSTMMNFFKDAKCSSIDSGTRNTGTITSGNALISSFGASNANICRGDGDVSRPVPAATIKSAIPNKFQARTSTAALRGLPAYATPTTGASSPTIMSPTLAGQANTPGSRLEGQVNRY